MSFRRRSHINWVSVIGLCIGFIGIVSLVYDHVHLPNIVSNLPIFPKPTATATPTVDDGASNLIQANGLFDQGKLDPAADAYSQAAAVADRAYSDFLFLAEKMDSAGNASEAAARRSDAQAALQRSATANARLCKILALRHRTGDAVSRCNRAIEINNRSAEAYANLALAYDRNNEFDKAIAAAQRAVDLDAGYAEGYAFLAEAYADKAPFDKRNLETALKAVKVDEKNGFAQRNLGWVYETEGNYPQAATAYTKATQAMPGVSYFYIDLCRAQKASGLTAEAIAACQKATELDPQNAEPFDRLGLLYYDANQNQNALAQFEKAIEVDRTYALAQGHLGWVYYFRMSSWEKAAAAFEKALELGAGTLSPSMQAELSTELGWSYYRLGRCTDARPAFDRALNLLARNTGPGTATLTQQAQDGLNACQGKK